jgi:hypothetical protein
VTSSIPMVQLMHQLDGTTWNPVGTLFTVDGTVYPGAPGIPLPYAGFASDIAWGLMTVADGMWLWDPIAYPAAVSPMGASVSVGRANLVASIMATPAGWPIVMSGYSQGAMVVDQCWVGDFLNPSGVLHNRLGDVKAIFNYGDPMRCPGVSNGNALAGIPVPGESNGQVTGGIAGPLCLTAAQTPDFFFSTNLPGDLYGSAPVGANPWTAESKVGAVETNIFNIVQKATFLDIISIAKDLLTPIATVEGIINGLVFFSAGQNAPHWQYGPYVGAAVGWMVDTGLSLIGQAA